MSEELLYEEIYKKTQDFGRTQFVKLLQQNQIKIKQLQQENEELKKHNLCTKKWTYGRAKEFYKEIDKIIHQKLKEQRNLKKKNRSLKEKLYGFMDKKSR